VISLYPAHTENAVALGAGHLLVGISRHDDPELLPGLPRIPLKAGAEVFFALKPDLVLARSLSVSQNPSLYKTLREAGIRVEVIDPPSWNDFHGYLTKLAGLLGVNPDEAAKRFRELGKAIADEARRRSGEKKKPLVFVEAASNNLRTCAPGSWAAHMIELAGGRNAAAAAAPVTEGSAVAAWGLERTLRTIKSGLDVYIVQHGAMNASTLSDVKKRQWAEALENIKTAEIPEAYLSRPTLTGLEKGGKILLDIFYGE